MDARFRQMQELFCYEYIKDFNATHAATRAGYSEATARSKGCELLAQPNIKAKIAELMQPRHDQCIADADEVLKYLTSVMRNEKTEEVVIATENGIEHVDRDVFVRDRNKAAEMLGRRYGLFDDKLKLSGGVGVMIVDDIPNTSAEDTAD